MSKCTMCDFRCGYAKREKIQLADISGVVFKGQKAEEREELDFMNGELSLEKNLSPLSYNAVVTIVTISGAEANDDFTVCIIAKIPTKVCPNCGKVLLK